MTLLSADELAAELDYLAEVVYSPPDATGATCVRRIRAHIDALTAVVTTELDALAAWNALGLTTVSGATRLTKSKEAELAELQNAAVKLVQTTGKAHWKALAAYRAALP